MRNQLRVFDQPFRKPYRHRRPPRLLQISKTKNRKAIQKFRRRKTAHLLEISETKKEVIDFSPEQRERIWRNTTG